MSPQLVAALAALIPELVTLGTKYAADLQANKGTVTEDQLASLIAVTTNAVKQQQALLDAAANKPN